MELRKAQEMGGGTLLISLPKDWVKKNGLVKGSTLAVESTVGGSLLIYPAGGEEKRPKEITIIYPAEYMQRLVNLITGAYLLGFHVIKVMANELIPYEDRDIVKKAMRQLVGLEIVEEDSRSITSQFLLEPTAIDPERALRRMFMITRGMLIDAVQALLEGDELIKKTVLERDDEVDRLYFLLVRLVRTAALDARLSAKLKVTTIDCLDYRLTAYLLEAIGDAAVEIAGAIGRVKPSSLDSLIKGSLESVGPLLEKMLEVSIKAFLSRSAEIGRQVVTLFGEVSKELAKLEELITANSKILSLIPVVAALDKISRCNVDIADLAFPLYPLLE